MVTIEGFRADFPEFGDDTAYSDAVLTFWLTVVTSLVSVEAWGELSDQGTELALAHHVVIAKSNQTTASTGGTPGVGAGVIQSQSVGDVSVSYAVNAGTLTDAGFWNLTTYGIQFLQLARMFGTTVLQF